MQILIWNSFDTQSAIEILASHIPHQSGEELLYWEPSSKACKLYLSNTRIWNATFNPSFDTQSAREILASHIPQQPEEELLYWEPSRSETTTLKSTYNLMISTRLEGAIKI